MTTREKENGQEGPAEDSGRSEMIKACIRYMYENNTTKPILLHN